MRMIVGLIIEKDDQDLVNDFIDENPEYKCTILPQNSAFCFHFPFKNMFSFIIGASKTYSGFKKFLKSDSGKELKGQGLTFIEVYSEDIIKYFQVYGNDNHEKFQLSTIRKPKYKWD